MKPILQCIALTCLCLSALTPPAKAQQPRLEKRGHSTQLIVEGKPFLVLGGELHNSSSSDLSYLRPLWAPIKQMNLNTALAAVSWELIEPKEGTFDFSLVDGILQGARANHLHVILLWFGSWKNGLSHYTPAWVKKDTKRFPRIVLENGKPTETISALSDNACKADAHAFAALMHHVKAVDAVNKTVIMMQVENEVGIIGGTRDHSAAANDAFAKPVPAQLLEGIHKNPSASGNSWTDVFGNANAADEAFMAWHYAQYINAVAKAGKAEYNIPMFVNTWIVQPEDKKPGDYPAGGPQSHVHDIWRTGAPAIDIFAPDIYLKDFKRITSLYHHDWNPLFIPESFSGKDGAANAFYAIGRHHAIGYSPFGIDGKTTDTPSQTPVAKAYKLLAQLSPEILAAQSKDEIAAVSLDSINASETIALGGYKITVTLRKNWSGVTMASQGYGLIIHTGPDTFIVAGADIDATFVPDSPGPSIAGILSVREGAYVNGQWKPGRWLNGDDIMVSYKLADEAAANRSGTGARIKEEPAILHIALYRY
jgi:hypothetical protein